MHRAVLISRTLARQHLRTNSKLESRGPSALNFTRSVNYDCFADRHIGPNELEKQQMLNYLGFKVTTVAVLHLK